MHEILGPVDYFPATGDDRNQESNQGCLDVPQVQARFDIEKLPAQTSSPAVRRSGNPDDMLRIRNMDTDKRARKNDSIDATQKCSDLSYKRKENTKRSCIEKTRISKKEAMTTWAVRVTKVKMDKALLLTTTRTATYHLQMVLKKKLTQQRLKKKTGLNTKKHRRSHGIDGKCKDSMLEQDSKKNEMETGAVNSDISEREMVEESCRMEP